MNEIELILAAQKGDLEAFNQLVLVYQDLVFRQSCYMLGDPDGAADVTQEVFIKAFTSLSTFRGGSFKAWLLRTATNTTYDELRRRKRHFNMPLFPVNEDDEENDAVRWMIDPAPEPEELTEIQENADLIHHLISQLKPAYQAALVLVDLQGLDYEEAAQFLEVPVGTVKSRLARARMQLKDQLLLTHKRGSLLSTQTLVN